MASRYKINIKHGEKYFYRLTLNQRIQHIILAVTVVLLVLTGVPLRFHDVAWMAPLYAVFGGIEYAPIVHRVAGSTMLLLFGYHLVYLACQIFRNEVLPMKQKGELTVRNVIKMLITQPLVPNLKDGRDILDLLKYLLFLSNERPKGAKWTWKEKFDYWAPFWGMLIIGTSGLILWKASLFSQFFTGEAINYALIMHSDEALLAALFLFIWHWYNVHFSVSVFPMGTAFLTGYLSEELMIEEHYEYYVEVMTECGFSGEIKPPHGQRPKTEDIQNEGPVI